MTTSFAWPVLEMILYQEQAEKPNGMINNASTKITPAHFAPRRFAAPLKLSLPTAEGYRFERISDIVYLAAEGNYTYIHLCTGEKLLVCRTLQELEQRLLGAHPFQRIHRSYLINLHYLARYVRGKGGYVVLENDISLNVSNSRRQAFLEALAVYFR
ncbi:MAG: LytTR family transcriptional regulator [Bacteroidetes bacterium]|nr:MAG: LytTR family transcriptional regulator [Bacteroidota bacterium]